MESVYPRRWSSRVLSGAARYQQSVFVERMSGSAIQWCEMADFSTADCSGTDGMPEPRRTCWMMEQWDTIWFWLKFKFIQINSYWQYTFIEFSASESVLVHRSSPPSGRFYVNNNGKSSQMGSGWGNQNHLSPGIGINHTLTGELN